jgi:hypothetical protein
LVFLISSLGQPKFPGGWMILVHRNSGHPSEHQATSVCSGALVWPFKGFTNHIRTTSEADSKGFWLWCVTLIITGLWALSVFQYSKNHRNNFQKLDLFPSSGEEQEAPTVLGPLERANPNHWSPSPEKGNRCGFRNVGFSSFQNTGRWTKSKK